MGTDEAPAPRIVVGVDGSASSRAALRWALGQARISGGEVHAVTSWEHPPIYGWVLPVADEEFAERAAGALAEAVRDVAGPAGAAQVRQSVACGNAAQVLLEAAGEADLLVVGNRGHRGFARALLGSVSQHCVQHSPCPVVVVRYRE
jgi:nucleotide-binding universal stress UspA family protein